MTQPQMKTPQNSIHSFQLSNTSSILDTKSLLVLGIHHPTTVSVIEIYRAQLRALAQLTQQKSVEVILTDFFQSEDKLQSILLTIDKYSIAERIPLIQNRLYGFKWVLLVSLFMLWSSFLLISFTGPISLMLCLIGLSALMMIVCAYATFEDNKNLFLHQESLKALEQPFFSRTASQNFYEINESLKPDVIVKNAFSDSFLNFPLNLRHSY